MKRFALIVCAALGLLASSSTAHAGGLCSLTYSGYQPCWNIFAHRPKCETPEEKRLQHFWHDYYHALKCYYGSLDHLDWVAYYKNHGYQINGGCGGPGGPGGAGCCHINYAPVFVSPTMQWAVPTGSYSGGPCGGPGGPGFPMGGY
jgi:hypothetical protein